MVKDKKDKPTIEDTRSRKFSLSPINGTAEKLKLQELTSIFVEHKTVTNFFIKEGMDYPASTFEKSSMSAVKRFYDTIRTKNAEVQQQLSQFGIKERARRCASQYAYYALQQRHNHAILLEYIADILLQYTWMIPQSQWKYWNMLETGKITADSDDFPTSALINRLREQIKTNELDTSFNSNHIANSFRQVRNMLYDRLSKISPSSSTIFRAEFEQFLTTQISNQYSDEYLEQLMYKMVRQLQGNLTRQVKLLVNGDLEHSKLEPLISKIIGDVEIEELTQQQWQQYRKPYRDQLCENLLSELDQLDLQELISTTIDEFQQEFNLGRLWKLVLKQEQQVNYRPGNDSFKEFRAYIKEIMTNHLYLLTARYYEDQITTLIVKYLVDLGENTLEWMDRPEFSQSSIPLGIDDGSVYDVQISGNKKEVIVTLSFRPHKKWQFQLNTPDRFYEQINHGYRPTRGVLQMQGGKLKLAIPFVKEIAAVELDKPVEEQKIAAIDQGLKTLVTISIGRNGKEWDRQFLDQHQLVGSKDSWFLPYQQRQELAEDGWHFTNYKRKLSNLQQRAFEARSQMDLIRNKNLEQKGNDEPFRHYSQQKEYWHKRRLWKWAWQKINNIHLELARQIASRIVSYASYHKIDCIRFEDLRWSNHSSKKSSGYFLTTWQIHWFHNKIQKLTEEMAKREGIAVKRINARYSSQLCSACGRFGSRKGKQFSCGNCGLQLDSDLNAARNLLKPNWEQLIRQHMRNRGLSADRSDPSNRDQHTDENNATSNY